MAEQSLNVQLDRERDPDVERLAEITLPFPELRAKREALEERDAATPAEREIRDLLSVRFPDDVLGVIVTFVIVIVPAVNENSGVVSALLAFTVKARRENWTSAEELLTTNGAELAILVTGRVTGELELVVNWT